MTSDFKDLLAYQKGYDLAMQIFQVSKSFPKEERYSLTDQIRRSSRSVCAQIAEGYRKRRYPKHFISKLSDADSENAETNVWLDFSLSCNYLNENEHAQLITLCQEVGKLLGYMINKPDRFR